jgi:putative ABC transport system ATP-binding protein
MCELNRDGATTMVITHDEHVAAACTRRIDMRDGQIVPGNR